MSLFRKHWFIWFTLLFSYSTVIYAQETQDALAPISQSDSANTIIQNIADQLPYFMRMVTAIAFVMGMYFVITGVIRLRHYGESRSMMSPEHSLKGPLIFITVGTLLIYLPSAIQVGMSSFWTNPNPYAYLEQESDQWAQIINVCFLIVQFVGVVAFIRGLVILSHLGGGHGQPGTFGRGLTHVIGGIFCINIYQFMQAVMQLLGIQT